MYNFGAGTLTFGSTAGVGGDEVGVLQDVSIEMGGTTKELRGAYKFPVAIATAAQKISGKAKSGTIDGALLTRVFGNLTLTNQLAGTDATFEMQWKGTYLQNGVTKNATFLAHAVLIPKLALAMKNDDFTMTDIDFECFANADGDVITITVDEGA